MTTEDGVWDAERGTLNTPSGVLAMATGNLKPHAPAQRHIKITSAPMMSLAEYRAAYDDSLWRQFMLWAMLGDESLIEYLQVAVGASLMGDQTCQHIFFCYGGGGNGKGAFDRMIRAAVGDYSTALKIGFFERKPVAASSDEYALAQLQGARMCVGSEVQSGARFDEAKLKAISGGDPINARHPYGRPFVIDPPTWVLWLLGNDKPQVTGTDDGIWRRLRLIPWLADLQKTAHADRIRDLEPRLRATELPLILRWAQEGAARWAATHTLPSCAPVDDATTDYRKAEDYVGRALDELCVFGKDATGRLPTTSKGVLVTAVSGWFRTRNIPRTQIDRKVSSYMRRVLKDHTPIVERRVGSKLHWVGVWVDAPESGQWN
jgi:putative DNA primase/helicase